MEKQSYKLVKAPEYERWLEGETEKSRVQIAKRLSHIETDSHFGDCKPVGDIVCELRWLNGRRVYYAYLQDLNILLLLGGNKNGQDKDIKQARKIFKKYTEI